MTNGVADTIYIDVMLFIYYFLYPSTSDLSRKSRNFFHDIENGRYVGIVSTFSVMEFIGVIKAIISDSLKRKISDNETQSMKKVILDFIYSMGIILYDSDSLTIPQGSTSCSLFSECENLIEAAKPTLGAFDKKWHSLKGADSLHVLFALRVNAQRFATFDDDFRGIDDKIKVLMIREEY